MKVYRIKTNDFAKLTKNREYLTGDQAQALEKYESLLGIKAEKFLPRGKDIILVIAQGKYYLTCKPAYIDSLRGILESVKISASDIIVMNRASGQAQELSIEQVKNFILHD